MFQVMGKKGDMQTSVFCTAEQLVKEVENLKSKGWEVTVELYTGKTGIKL